MMYTKEEQLRKYIELITWRIDKETKLLATSEIPDKISEVKILLVERKPDAFEQCPELMGAWFNQSVMGTSTDSKEK